jgi:hypothetical protein
MQSNVRTRNQGDPVGHLPVVTGTHVERDRGSGSREHLVDRGAEYEQAWKSGNSDREPLRVGGLEIDLVCVHSLPSSSTCMFCRGARIRRSPHG